jgi:hypothetical protein
MAEVIINIAPDGKVSVKAEGWNGPSCSTITEPYRKALGRETSMIPTAESYLAEVQDNAVEAVQ